MNHSTKNWYLVSPEFRKGPYPQSLVIQALKEGKIKYNLGACPEGSDEWKPLSAWGEFSESSQAFASNSSQNSQKHEGVSAKNSPLPNATRMSSSQKTATEHESLNEMVDDLNNISLPKEVIPINLSNFSHLMKDMFFWGMISLGIGPLLICTFEDIQIQSSGMAFFFAALWGVVFKVLVAKNCRVYGLSLVAFFFTGIIGISSLLLVLRFLPVWYVVLPDSQNVFVRLVGSIIQTGIMEELCKFTPAGLYLLWKRREAKPQMIVWIAICSALGFAAFENLFYMKSIAINVGKSASLQSEVGVPLAQTNTAVQGAMLAFVLRLLSCVFGHAVYSGILAYFVAIAFVTKQRIFVLCCLGLLLAATFHGVCNWFLGVQPTFAAISDAFAFVLFYCYLNKLRVLTGEENLASH